MSRIKRIVSPTLGLGILLIYIALTVASMAQSTPPQPQVTSAALAEARAALLHAIKPGMDFLTFRRIVFAQGWIPITHTPPCLNQIDEALCAQLPEVFNTSSGPVEYNEMSYRHLKSGESLHVIVAGDISAWGTSDATTELSVDHWDFDTSSGN